MPADNDRRRLHPPLSGRVIGRPDSDHPTGDIARRIARLIGWRIAMVLGYRPATRMGPRRRAAPARSL